MKSPRDTDNPLRPILATLNLKMTRDVSCCQTQCSSPSFDVVTLFFLSDPDTSTQLLLTYFLPATSVEVINSNWI